MRSAKRISRAILATAQASALGGAAASDGEDDEVIDMTSRVVLLEPAVYEKSVLGKHSRSDGPRIAELCEQICG